MKFLMYIGIFFCIMGMELRAQVKTVLFYPLGNPSAEPIIELGSSQQLFFAFDDLSQDVNSYSYKLVHCDPDWKSSNLSPFTYLSGFLSNPLDDYNYSFNTGVQYTHFALRIPNSEVSIKLSGNYLLQVYNDENPDSVVISRRFSVLDRQVAIAASVVNCTNPRYLHTSQQVNFTINYTNLQIYNPIRDVRAYVSQNQDLNTRKSFTPVFIRQNQLVYGNGEDNVFSGLSPFRNFQSSSLVYYTQYVKDVLKGPDGMYNFILQPSTVPSAYVPLPDRGGNFYIAAENTQQPDLEADYIVAHFAVLYPNPIPGADVYVYGKFSDWQLLPELKMSYDLKNRAYTGQGEFKQGYYDYMYAVVADGNGKPDLVTLQNSFYQNQDGYEIRFYLYDYNLAYFRFIGYQTLRSGL